MASGGCRRRQAGGGGSGSGLLQAAPPRLQPRAPAGGVAGGRRGGGKERGRLGRAGVPRRDRGAAAGCQRSWRGQRRCLEEQRGPSGALALMPPLAASAAARRGRRAPPFLSRRSSCATHFTPPHPGPQPTRLSLHLHLQRSPHLPAAHGTVHRPRPPPEAPPLGRSRSPPRRPPAVPPAPPEPSQLPPAAWSRRCGRRLRHRRSPPLAAAMLNGRSLGAAAYPAAPHGLLFDDSRGFSKRSAW